MKIRMFLSVLMLGLSITLFAQEAPAVEAPAGGEAEKPAVVEKPAETEAAPATEKTAAPAPVRTDTPAQPRPAVSSGGEEARLLGQISSNPKNSEAYYALLRLYAAQGKHKERIQLAVKAVNNLGPTATLYTILGDEYKAVGDYSRSMTMYQFALSITPTDANTYNRLGLALLKLSQFNQAEASFKAAVYFGSGEGSASLAVFYNNLAVAYEAMHDLQTAYKYFQIAVRTSSSYQTASENLARVGNLLKSGGLQP